MNINCSFLCLLPFFSIPLCLVIVSSLCPFVSSFFSFWQFECLSVECPAVGLLCVIQPLMLSCKHSGGKTHKVFICLATVSPWASPFFAVVLNPFTIRASISNFSLSSCAIFCICLSPIFTFFLSAPLLSAIPPLLPLSTFPIIPLSLFLLASLFSGPICSHYIDGSDDSLEWCTLSPVPLQGLSPQPSHAALLCSDSRLSSFSVGTKTAWHLLVSRVTSWYYRTGHRSDLCADMLFI